MIMINVVHCHRWNLSDPVIGLWEHFIVTVFMAKKRLFFLS